MQEKDLKPIYENNEENIKSIISRLSNDFNSQKKFIKILNDNIKNISPENREVIVKMEKINCMLPNIIEKLGLPFCDLIINNREIINYYLENYVENEKDEIYKKIFLNIINVFNYKSVYNNIGNFIKEILKNKKNDIKEIEMNKRTKLNEIEKLYDEFFEILKNINNFDENKFYSILTEKINKIKEIQNKNIYPRALIDFLKEKIQIIESIMNENKFKNQQKQILNSNNNQIKYHPTIDYNIIYKEIKELRKSPLKRRTFFYRNEILAEGEDEFIEFKNYFYPLDEEQKKEIKRQYCGFLNSQGGRIYIGINDQKIVKGIELTYKEQDIFRKSLVLYGNEFHPKCGIDKIKVYFIPLKNMITKKFINNFFVVKIIICPGEQYELYSMTIKGFNCSKRLQGQSINLTADEIEKEIIDRAFLKTNPKKKINFEDYDDPKPEINLDFVFEKEKKDKDKLIIKSKLKNIKKKVEYIVMIKNIDVNLKVKDINRHFNGVHCSSQKFPKKVDGKSTGIGKLYFNNEDAAKQLIQKYDKDDLGGNKKIIMTLKKYTYFKKATSKK